MVRIEQASLPAGSGVKSIGKKLVDVGAATGGAFRKGELGSPVTSEKT